MTVLLAAFLSPLAMIVVAGAIVAIAKILSLPKPKVGALIWMSIALAAAGAIASLIYTIGWMIWYENTTGYSAGNAPLGWIFFYGPASAALGQLLALIVWWFRKPRTGVTNAA
jgi:hypothetical protein